MGSRVVNIVGRRHRRLVKPRQAERLADYLVRFLPPEGRVLDVGCGTGRIARLLVQRNAKLRVGGMDILAQPQAEIPVTVFDGLHIPLASRAVDAVILVDVLHHMDAQLPLLRESLRVSRGPVVIKDHLSETDADRAILAFMDWVGNRSLGIASPRRYCSLAQWQQLFDELGVREFERIPVTGLYPFPFRWVCERNKQVLFRIRL